MSITKEKFQEIIEIICSDDTSADPKHWSAENPTWGHCAVVALLAQDQFGGALIRQSFENVEGFGHLLSHYSNKLAGGSEVDFTQEQFQGRLPQGLIKEERPRERVLSYPDTKRRYELLKDRFETELLKI